MLIECDPATTKPTEWMLKSEGHFHDHVASVVKGRTNCFFQTCLKLVWSYRQSGGRRRDHSPYD